MLEVACLADSAVGTGFGWPGLTHSSDYAHVLARQAREAARAAEALALLQAVEEDQTVGVEEVHLVVAAREERVRDLRAAVHIAASAAHSYCEQRNHFEPLQLPECSQPEKNVPGSAVAETKTEIVAVACCKYSSGKGMKHRWPHQALRSTRLGNTLPCLATLFYSPRT